MKAELKGIKVYDRMSEETICYTATLYLDGKKAADVENGGKGGCTNCRFFDKSVEEKFNAYVKTLPDKVYPATDKMKSFSVKMSDEQICDDLLDEYLKKQDEKKLAKNDAKNKAYFTSHGYPFTLRLIMDGKHTWMASKTDSDADAARMVAECETKNKTKVLSWKWI